MSVNQISGVIREIRECVNNPWKQRNLLANRKNWHMICASMDVIEDSQLAINDFYRLPRFTANSGGYLYLYGLLQAFFVQQDAVSNLNQSLFDCHMHSISAHYISVHQKFINKQQPC